MRAVREIPAPLDVYRDVVRSEWIDQNKHMNVGYYLVVFDFATDAWMEFIGLDGAHRQERRITTFCLEAHVVYLREVRAGDPLRFTTRLLAYDAKRLHYIHAMYHAGEEPGGEPQRVARAGLAMVGHVGLEAERGDLMLAAMPGAEADPAHELVGREVEHDQVVAHVHVTVRVDPFRPDDVAVAIEGRVEAGHARHRTLAAR